MDDWISVDDRLPEQYTNVIVLYDIGRVGVNWTNKENEFVSHAYGKITHWMPLPEPPKDYNALRKKVNEIMLYGGMKIV